MAEATDPPTRVRDGIPTADDRSLLARAGLAGVGGALLVRGLRSRSLGGVAMAGAGGYALYRALASRGSETEPAGESVTDESTSGDYRTAADRPRIERSITITASPDELAELVSEPETIDRLVGPAATVEPIDDDGDHHRWTIAGPFDLTTSWETELLAEQPGTFGRWRSTDRALLPVEYSIAFEKAPADRGTEVTLRLWLDPPGGRLGTVVVDRLLDRDVLVSTALYRLKSLAETGEIPTLDRNPSARGRGDLV